MEYLTPMDCTVIHGEYTSQRGSYRPSHVQISINRIYLSMDFAVAYGSHAVTISVQHYLRLYLLDLFPLCL